VQVDDKLSALADCLKKNNVNNISQLCSDWWELTDEDDYTIQKFVKAYRDEKARREIKHMMSLEILSIAIVNYFTSSPEIFRPTAVQLNQVKSLLSQVQSNFINVVDFILQKLP
jgi:Ser/Thr protein kinase RdoA (MazF antagonist)